MLAEVIKPVIFFLFPSPLTTQPILYFHMGVFYGIGTPLLFFELYDV